MLALFFLKPAFRVGQFLIGNIQMRLEVDVVVAEFADFALDRFQLAGDLVVLADFVFQQLGAFGQVLLQFLFAVTNRF